MIIINIVLILGILIDGILSSYFTHFIPFVFISFCVTLLPILKKDNNIFIIIFYLIVFDLLFSNVFLFYTFLYLIILMIANYIYKMFKHSYLSVIMFTITMFLINYLLTILIFIDKVLPLDIFLEFFISCFIINNINFLVTLMGSKKKY